MTKYNDTEFYAGCSIEEAMRILLREEECQGPTKGKFNNAWLYSDEDSINSAYMKITGQTQAQHREFLVEENRRIEEERKAHENLIPYLTTYYRELGHKILNEDKWDYWDEIVPVRLRDLYHGMELGNCLDIIEILNNDGSLEDAKKEMYSQVHSGMSWGLVKSMVASFSDRGKEFFDYVD